MRRQKSRVKERNVAAVLQIVGCNESARTAVSFDPSPMSARYQAIRLLRIPDPFTRTFCTR